MSDKQWPTRPNEPVMECLGSIMTSVGDQVGMRAVGCAAVVMLDGGQSITVSSIEKQLDVRCNRMKLVDNLQSWADDKEEDYGNPEEA